MGHTCRKDSIYDLAEEELVNHSPTLGSPWAFSSSLSGAGLAGENAITDSASESSKGDMRACFDPFSSNASEDSEATWSFEKISTFTGLSVAEFAAQVSATAEETLRRMSGDMLISDTLAFNPGPLQTPDEYINMNQISTWLPSRTRTPPLALPLADINMRHLESSWNSDCVGVNPADIYSVPVTAPDIVPERLFLLHPDDVSSSHKDTCLKSSPDNSVGTPETGSHLDATTPGPDTASPYEEHTNLTLARSKLQNSEQISDDEPSIFPSPSSSEYSPPLKPLGIKRNQSSRITTRRNTRKSEAEEPDSFPEYQDNEQYNHVPLNLGTPVFDAHRGIDIEDLKAKAERYRLRNQGRDYDKRWLISFAGKLSEKGELVEEFRCYVSGCKQSNKRRDHILIHVGAHLDQRPFKCMHWQDISSSRFLRKNECKRHELSHTGIRPFSCHLCPSPATTFVRQDLLKRHMKRTHHIDFKVDKENEESHRPKKRARY
ncbi:Transcriptional regulator CRZ1 [Psilocybe cubensis]|uniref:Transcriptional regulator CRZ1 n=2 Tax=Psilocybe cubensis TaxID=181762 RepID=A0ACB8H5E2_PSICU|nr:Transcriptional regulator CRZ1 [Psilocybe cubensis]KAH9482405.1 Transcriptional regulator CRZ1 [Psilocybe cubensis]